MFQKNKEPWQHITPQQCLSWPSAIYLWWCFFTFISTTCNKNRSKWQLLFQTPLTAQRSQVSPRQRAHPSFRTIYQHTWWHQHQQSLWLAVCMSELIRRGQQVFECVNESVPLLKRVKRLYKAFFLLLKGGEIWSSCKWGKPVCCQSVSGGVTESL